MNEYQHSQTTTEIAAQAMRDKVNGANSRCSPPHGSTQPKPKTTKRGKIMTELTENEVNAIKDALKKAKKECKDIASSYEGWCTGEAVEAIQKALKILS